MQSLRGDRPAFALDRGRHGDGGRDYKAAMSSVV